MKSRQLFILLGIASLLIVIGAILKIQHIAGGEIAMGLGVLFQFGIIIYAVTKSMGKKS